MVRRLLHITIPLSLNHLIGGSPWFSNDEGKKFAAFKTRVLCLVDRSFLRAEAAREVTFWMSHIWTICRACNKHMRSFGRSSWRLLCSEGKERVNPQKQVRGSLFHAFTPSLPPPPFIPLGRGFPLISSFTSVLAGCFDFWNPFKGIHFIIPATLPSPLFPLS